RSRAEAIIYHSSASRRHIESALAPDRPNPQALANVLAGAIRHFDVETLIDLAEYIDDVLQSRIAAVRDFVRGNSPPAQPIAAVNPPQEDKGASKGKKIPAVSEASK
ncbi:MAG: hypothetical protein KGL39_17190, partial [Patescibacteria group bacterium]|nr:hypothetical protein [Patescibacteria group bacterium]